MTMNWPQAGQIILSTNDHKSNSVDPTIADANAVHQLVEPDREVNESISESVHELDCLRDHIDLIDAQLKQLLIDRFEVARQIAKQKRKFSLPIKDPARENALLTKLFGSTQEEPAGKFISAVFRELLNQSVAFQSFEMNKLDNSEVESNSPQSIETSKPACAFPKICIIGAGLIGGGFARKIKTSHVDAELFAIDFEESLTAINASKIFTQTSSDPQHNMIKEAALIVLACPPDANLEVLKNIAPLLRAGQIVIDLSSTKSSICSLAENLDLNGAEFIGAHPFFGNEKQGFEASESLEMKGKTFCLVPTSKSSSFSVARLRAWLAAMEFRVFTTEAGEHDKTVALTSHLIQLFASALGSTIFEELIENDQEDHLILSGGALSNLSRLMNSPEDLWEQVSGQNSAEINRVSKIVFSKISAMCSSQNKTVRATSEAKTGSHSKLADLSESDMRLPLNNDFPSRSKHQSIAGSDQNLPAGSNSKFADILESAFVHTVGTREVHKKERFAAAPTLQHRDTATTKTPANVSASLFREIFHQAKETKLRTKIS